MRLLTRLFLICTIIGLISCKEKDAQPREDATLFLRHKGADMPIWIKGNRQPNKIVLFVHGGPGDCAMCYRYYLKDLEEDVMMAYQVREWALKRAKEKGNKEAEDFLIANPITPQNTGTVNWEGIYRWMHKLDGNPVSLYSDKKYVINYAFASPNTALAQFTHSKAYGYYGDIESRTFEKGNLLQNVRIPVGLFWGKKDGIVPFEIGLESKDLLKNTQVTQVTFEQSWHEPFITETAEFASAVRAFVGQK
ncbi:alpha/beta fold hydrolase [Dyadobacter chenhuakuii]|uniref:Alpha/beta hydrolase n=1 Tax=Dyadobacter chenhuakuii TaxID=2909339 RepID=A0A9X1QE92_9BACT|nr:alpha/beta hydrolase [Dyadobacter chenhuakuii]MCF2498882.1 alpha/beta hydrolase [Dyadobacter chenhuakuii]